MKAKNIILLLVLTVIIASIFYAIHGSKDQTAYINQIKKEREEKDVFMRNAPDSPFSDNKENFKGLKYFPPDPKFRVTANLVPIEKKKLVTLTTNDGKEQRYMEYAYAEFDLSSFRNQLLILEMIDMGPERGKLFLAFGDDTSAEETYGAGRYLDVAKAPGANTITLDFNKAYNPYCAYAETYSCPLPPAENLLNIPISAGEKTYHE